MLRRISSLLLVMAASSPFGTSQDVIVCDFTGTEPSLNTPWTGVSYLAPGLNYSGWDLGPGAHPRAGINDAFGFYVNVGSPESTLAEAIADGEYLTVTLDPGAGTLDLNGKRVRFGIQRISWHAPMRYSLFTSIDGFTQGTELFTSESTGKGEFDPLDFTFIMPLTGYGGVTGPVEFRLYAHEAEWGGHETSLNVFSIEQPGTIYTLTLNAEAGGSASTDPPGSLFEEGTAIRFMAAPDTNSRFSGWTGDVEGLGNPRTVTIQSDLAATAGFEADASPRLEIGMNLGGVVDWTTAWPFVDAFKMSRSWLTRLVGGSEWSSGRSDEIPVDANGWPTEIPFLAPSDGNLHFVHTLMPAHVSGDYTVMLEGAGKIAFWGAADTPELFPSGGGTTTFTVTVNPGDEGALYINLFESSLTDPIRNIRVIRPGFVQTYATEPFHPLYMERLDRSVNLRFMDWGKTNASPLVTWDARTTPFSYTQTREEGVSLEYMVELANALGMDPWICIPHKADDDFVRNAAILLRDTVASGLKIHVEYSNETWNSAGPFSQTVYVQDMGELLGLDPDRWTAGQKYCALRSVQIWEIFEQEFVDDSRLVKVMGTQSANISISLTRYEALNDPSINPDYTMPDALAIAPYFGKLYTLADIPPAAPSYPTVDDILDLLSPQLIESSREDAEMQQALADEQGAALTCYEGGQHFVGGGGAENDETLTDILQTANRDPRMYTRYIEYLDALRAEGVSLFSNFSYVGRYSKWGSWSILEYQDQPVMEAPKYRAIIGWNALRSNLQTLSAGSGGTIDLLLDARATRGNRTYFLLGSLSGVTPGLSLPGGYAILPLNWDPFTDIVLSHLNTTVFTNFRGSLDGQGSAVAQLNAPPLPPSAVGLDMFYAYCLSNPFDFASNHLEIEIVP